MQSTSLLGMFRECGWTAFLALLIGAGGLAAGVVGLVLLATKARGAAWIAGALAMVLGAGAVGAGLLGRQMGLAQVEAIVSDPTIDIDPTQREAIRRMGTQEANQCVPIGAALGALPFVMGALAVGAGLALQRKPG